MPTPDTSDLSTAATNGVGPGSRQTVGGQVKRLAIAAGILILCFGQQLWQWVQFGLTSELYSYTLLIPFISVYVAWTQKDKLALSPPSARLGALFSGVAIILLGLYWFKVRPLPGLEENDRLFFVILSFVLLFLAACALFLGARVFRTAAFAAAFLFFMAPLPSVVEHATETFLQHRSADTACFLIKLSGMPILRQDTLLILPGLKLNVAPECSGIRSTLVLFLTGLIAGHFFLRKPLNKAILAGSVIVLGILRNGFRILTLAQLTVNVDPSIIDSPLHHRGGPIFFALFLIPFFGLLLLLRRTERRKKQITPSQH